MKKYAYLSLVFLFFLKLEIVYSQSVTYPLNSSCEGVFHTDYVFTFK